MANASPWARRFVVAGILIGFTVLPSKLTHVMASSKPAVVASYSVLPGESMNFQNRKYRRIEVRSTFPIRVLTGPCHEEYVVQFTCDSAPGDVFITDRRSKPLFGSPEANQITITEIKK